LFWTGLRHLLADLFANRLGESHFAISLLGIAVRDVHAELGPKSEAGLRLVDSVIGDHLRYVAQTRAGGTHVFFGVIDLGRTAAANVRESTVFIGIFAGWSSSSWCAGRCFFFAALRGTLAFSTTAGRAAEHIFDTIHETRLVLRQFLHDAPGQSFQIPG
jgi:hypothetical protein